MKQQTLRYLLIAAVLLVWGMIIFKVVTGMTDSDPGKTSAPVIQKNSFPPEIKDSFFLYANYPDPFIPLSDTVIFDKPLVPSQVSAVQQIPPVIKGNVTAEVGFIKYHGMISNPVKNIKAALLSIDNKDVTMKEKETAENVKVKKIYADKILVLYNHKMYTIFKLN